jgi:pimeloyl-ACP methyl ester carboxylesterase
MPGIVYALLVGIDKYPKPEHRLSGCRNDVAAFEQLLRLRVAPAALRLETLLDEQASRGAVIQRFQEHLGKAGRGDTALFFYAGHGSQERAPEEFLPVEPDGLDETLVLWDSREAGQWDLADKEVAALIREAAANGSHMVAILDCCHSGSGTRRPADEGAPKVRRLPKDGRIRPLHTLLPQAQAAAARSLGDSGWDLGDEGRHILLAACRDDQEAAEYAGEGQKRGAFSYFLLDALREAPANVTYRDLAAIARARVAASVSNQTPQVEATEDADLDRAFLGGAIQARAGGFLATERQGEWWIDGGRIHGVPLPVGSEAAYFALFSATATAADMEKMADAVARAEAVQVEASSTRLRIVRGAPDAGKPYKAVLVGVPLPSRGVRLSGDEPAVTDLRTALKASTEVAEVKTGGDFLLECAPGEFHIRNGGDARLLTAPAATAAEAVSDLDHIARWLNFAQLENPSSAIGESEFKVGIFEGRAGNVEISGTDLRFTSSRTEQGALVPRQFRLSFENRSRRDLFFAVLAMDELYSCSTNLIRSGVVRVRPGDMPAWALDGKALKTEVPEALRREGRTTSRDILKVIVSTTDFEIRKAALGALRAPPRNTARGIVGNTLDRMLARRSQSRTISAADDNDTISDFRTWTILLTTVEPRATVELSGAGAVDIGAGVTVEAHPGLTASARLTTAEETRSDLGNSILPPLLRSSPEGSETVRFTSSRGSSPGLCVLELSDISNQESVTAETPLVARLPVALAEGEVLLPIGWDGEDYLILGQGAAVGAETAVNLQRLPHPVYKRTRSLTGSIKIVFQKFSSKLLGTVYEYPVLAEASWDSKGKVHFNKDKAAIQAKVAAAQRVVVFVHGIIGDTFAMGARVVPRPEDVLLTFDYENLNTSIQDNAAGLRRRLAEHGLGEGHGKELILVAHSMGGLISRWFVEVLGGSKTVSRLILCGTPNAGSPWSTMEDCVTGIASLALNHLTGVSWEAAAIGTLFAGLPKVDNSLKQMKPGCALLTSLAASADPRIGYTILAGNTSLAGAAAGGRVQNLLKKVLHGAVSPAFLFAPNDIAVSVTSIESVNDAWNPGPQKIEVACDHLSYFSSEAGVKKLRALLG